MRKAGKLLEKRGLRLNRLPRRAQAGRPTALGPLPGASRRRQRDVLCDVMLSASQCDTWLTLDELAMLTHYPPASISAQLRHLRKQEFGGYEVEKQQRLPAEFCTEKTSARFGSTGCSEAYGGLAHRASVRLRESRRRRLRERHEENEPLVISVLFFRRGRNAKEFCVPFSRPLSTDN